MGIDSPNTVHKIFAISLKDRLEDKKETVTGEYQ